MTEPEAAYNAAYEAATKGTGAEEEEEPVEDEGDDDVEDDDEEAYVPPGGDWRVGAGTSSGRGSGGGGGGSVKRRLWISAEARARWLGVLNCAEPNLASVSVACVALRMACRGFGILTEVKGGVKLTREEIELQMHSWCHATAFGSAATAKGRASTAKKKGAAAKGKRGGR